jgi:hypothetical protein
MLKGATMISIKTEVDDNIKNLIKSIRKEINDLPKASLDKFISLTPIDKGNARRRTRLQGKDTIVADYAYAEKLDTGSSKQAPRGMTEPFQNWFRDYTEKRFKK